MTTILMPIYDGVTQLDFTGPHQFFCRVPEVTLIVASMGARPVESHGLTFGELEDLEAVERCDVLCVPGGAGCAKALEDDRFLDQIRRLAPSAAYLTSVCTGSLILGAAGLLEGKRAACHWGWRDMLAEFGAIPDEGRVVRDGNIITGGGVTAGIDFALTVIAELRGAEVAQATQLVLEYAPAPPFDSGRPELAPQAIRELVTRTMGAELASNRARVKAAAERLRVPA